MWGRGYGLISREDWEAEVPWGNHFVPHSAFHDTFDFDKAV